MIDLEKSAFTISKLDTYRATYKHSWDYTNGINNHAIFHFEHFPEKNGFVCYAALDISGYTALRSHRDSMYLSPLRIASCLTDVMKKLYMDAKVDSGSPQSLTSGLNENLVRFSLLTAFKTRCISYYCY